MKAFSTLKFAGCAGLLLGMLTSCSPRVMTYRIEPVSGEVATIDGRPVTKAEQNGVGVVASFEREDLDYVALDVEIKNHTDHPIDVNPADFQFVGLGAAQDTLVDANTKSVLIRSAADPAYEAGRMDVKRNGEIKRIKRAKLINTVLLVAAIASDASSAGRSRSYGEWVGNRVRHDLAYRAIAVKRVVDHGLFANRMERYDYEDYRWRELALRAHTVQPGQSVRGLVYLLKTPRARYLAVSYNLPGRATVPLLFSQESVKERKRR